MADSTDNDRRYQISVDIGGTFVDAMELDQRTQQVRFRKASTTPAAPWRGVLAAIDGLGTDLSDVGLFIHGTTLGLNAVLERRGGATGIITNDGMRDIFLIGRGNIPASHMYDFTYDRPPALVERRHTVGVKGRLDHRGREIQPLDEDGVRTAAEHLVALGVGSIAICFMHSYRDPSHEERAAAIVRHHHPEITVSTSTSIAREYREYERTATTVLDAYIRPIFERYVTDLERELAARGFAGRFQIMRSGGGSMTADAARRSPTNTVLSGPAGGIIGGCHVAAALGRDDVVTVDIGGTSFDACVIEGGAAASAFEAELEHYPLLVPIYDIRTIGAGGGSIAWLDGGLLKVGPRSAGADPGPVCYGRGGVEPTVTDAAVCLGYVDPTSFLGGEMRLADHAARSAVGERLAEPLGISVTDAAASVFDVLLARTVGAVRQITVERGHDPRAFSLMAFGGAGPLISPLLAREMEIGEVIVPADPSGFSAWGMLGADLVEDASRTLMAVLEDAATGELGAVLAELDATAAESVRAQGVAPADVALERRLELRYLGQEHALPVPVGTTIDVAALRTTFEELHLARYGHAMDNRVQVLNARVRAIGRAVRPRLPAVGPGDGDASRARTGTRPAFDFGTRATTDFAVYDRSHLEPGDVIAGPALVDEGTSTTVVASDQQVAVEDHGYLLVTAVAR
jgi:N-methylhydantoinase A/oxoprolinase/acetone carboxylase beta subunit